ncbi:MAG: tRNA 2-thiouridine(34) synthase MnmA [Ilumatobacteraceae bacterium]
MRVLLGMSGGVDSSVAAAVLRDDGHEVVGVTMRLWGGESDSGCCSVADVDDARRAAQQLGVDHLVFNFSDEFDERVVAPYVEDHRRGRTPNPCIECNRHLKFDRLLDRATALGFDAVATGHHARIVERDGRRWVGRGADHAKDQSYVVHMLDQDALARTVFPIGHLTKDQVRAEAARLGLRTATKPDSQDVCFITSTGGRETFLGDRIPFRRAKVVDPEGVELGELPAVELVTVGQRRGLHLLDGAPRRRYVIDVDHGAAVVTVGPESELMTLEQSVTDLVWADIPVDGPVLVQCSAHGRTSLAELGDGVVRWAEPQRRVSAGQSLVFYDLADERVLGGGLAG